MNVLRLSSNQKSFGIVLRRSTIYETWRWSLSINRGFNVTSYSWNKNPPWPKSR